MTRSVLRERPRRTEVEARMPWCLLHELGAYEPAAALAYG